MFTLSKYISKNGQWVTPEETSGSIQNTSSNVTIEVTANAKDNQGLILAPMQIVNFEGTIYVKSSSDRDASFTVVPFKVSAGGGGRYWTANTEYPKGVFVIYRHCLYKCTATHTSGTTFSDTCWYKVGVSNEGDTFTGPIAVDIKGSDLIPIYLKAHGTTKGTNPSAEKTFGIQFQDGDTNNVTTTRYGSVYGAVETNGTCHAGLRAFKNIAGANNYAQISVAMTTSGEIVTFAPTPASTSNDTNIATTAWVKNYTSGTCTNSSSVSGGNIRWYKNGRMATITLFNVKTSTTSSSNIQLTADAPKALSDMYMTAVTISGKPALVHVNATGSVVIYNNITTTEGFFGTVSYLTSDVTS